MKTKNKDRYFFIGMGIWFIIITLLGFSSSFYLPDAEPQMSFYLKFHGFIFSCWIILFLAQTVLIASNKRKLHIMLGWLGLVLCFAIFLSGVYTSLMKTPMYVTEVGDNLSYIITFLIFVLLGVKNRKKPTKHKRHLVFSTVILTSAAVARINIFGIDFGAQISTYYIIMFLPVIALFGYDLIIRKKIYKVNIYNSAFIFAMLFFTNFVFKTKLWTDLVNQMIELLT